MTTEFRSHAISAIAAMLLALPLAVAGSADDPRELEWDELMPEDWRPFDPYRDLDESQLDQLYEGSPLEQKLMQEYIEAKSSAPVVHELNGQRVKIPGYVVPLEYSGTALSEFLLVPYFGACIHVPPPPANQIVFVKTEEPFKAKGLFTAVWVTGTISTDAHLNEVGDAGYTITASKVELYEMPTQ